MVSMPNDDPQRVRRTPVWLPVVVSCVVQIVSLLIAAHSAQPVLIIAGAVAFGASFLLVAAGRASGPIVAVVAALCTPGITLIGGPPLAAAPLVFAVIFAVHRGARVWVWSSLGAVALVGGIGGQLAVGNPFVSVRVLIVVIALCLVVALAEGARARRARYRAASMAIAARRQSATEAERLRIARELHDVLAHSLSQISVQAGVGLHLFDADPQRAKDSLASIKETSGRALDEVRGVLGMLRADGEQPAKAPEPDLDSLPELVRTVRDAGLRVTVSTDLVAPVPSAVQFAIYRIVQESLTNVLRHSGSREATVRVAEAGTPGITREGGWVVEIVDNGPTTIVTTHGRGRGLVGMRERAENLGGRLSADAVADGGFRVVAEIPHTASGRSGKS